MSFWDGSLWEQRLEEQKRRDQIRLNDIHKKNPSLSWDDVRKLLEIEKSKILANTPVRCCVCTTGKREYVRINEYLGPCQCSCHNLEEKST